MKRGLYVRAGDCATARLAACAISLLGPTTNDSKVFRGLSPSALALALVSRGDSGEISLDEAASSRGICVVAPDGEENLTPRGLPSAVTMAVSNAGI